MNGFQDFATILNTIMLIAVAIGGYLALHSGKSKTANETQDRIINAMQTENLALNSKIERIEREAAKQEHTLTLILAALKTRGLTVSIEGELISIYDNGKSTFGRIQGS